MTRQEKGPKAYRVPIRFLHEGEESEKNMAQGPDRKGSDPGAGSCAIVPAPPRALDVRSATGSEVEEGFRDDGFDTGLEERQGVALGGPGANRVEEETDSLPRGETKEPAAQDAPATEAADLRQQLEQSLAREKRWLADLDNYRRRTERLFEDQAELRKRALAIDLLEILDDLERALEHASDTEAGLAPGVEAIRGKMLAILARHGIKPFHPLNEPFDPSTQEAVATIHHPELGNRTVAQVVRAGWKAGDKLLRPAHVVVVKND